MARAAGPRGPKAAGVGEAWARAASAEADLVAEAVAGEAVDLAGGVNDGEI